MFKKRSEKKEIIDFLEFSDSQLIKNLHEFEIINRWLGTRAVLINALKKIYKKHIFEFNQKNILIADLGCGGGDLLRNVSQWLNFSNIKCELLGFDNHPLMIHFAINASKGHPTINFKQVNIIEDDLENYHFDIVCLNNVCHHFTDESLKVLIEKLMRKTRLAIIINDLHRHWIPYFTIKLMTKIFNLSLLAKHDGPLSVLRAFERKDFLNWLPDNNSKQLEIRWCWPFRWQVIIGCKKGNIL